MPRLLRRVGMPRTGDIGFARGGVHFGLAHPGLERMAIVVRPYGGCHGTQGLDQRDKLRMPTAAGSSEGAVRRPGQARFVHTSSTGLGTGPR